MTETHPPRFERQRDKHGRLNVRWLNPPVDLGNLTNVELRALALALLDVARAIDSDRPADGSPDREYDPAPQEPGEGWQH